MNQDQAAWSNPNRSAWAPPSAPSSPESPADTRADASSTSMAMRVAYEAHARQLLRVAYVLTGSTTAAEDVVHDVFIQAGRHLPDVRESGPYLRTAVVNRCRSLHRRTQAAPQLPLGQDAHLDVGLLELRDSLAALSSKQRTAIVLRYLCDLSDADIAATLGVRQATVRSLIFRGLRELRSSMSQTPTTSQNSA